MISYQNNVSLELTVMNQITTDYSFTVLLVCVLCVLKASKESFFTLLYRTVRSSSMTRRRGQWTRSGTRRQIWGRVDWPAALSHQRSRVTSNQKGELNCYLSISRSWNSLKSTGVMFLHLPHCEMFGTTTHSNLVIQSLFGTLIDF